MASYALTIKRLQGQGIIRKAAKHNLREIAAEFGVDGDGRIDITRTPNNFILRGKTSAEEVQTQAKTLMSAAGTKKLRKDAVLALELLFMLPATSTVDAHEYFEHATLWAEQYFGVPLLSSIIHFDEGAPHCHVLLLPLVNGKMNGSDLHGGASKLWAMQTSFHLKVGGMHGLPKPARKKRLSTGAQTNSITLARACLRRNSALSDTVIDELLKPHAKDPEPLLLALGLIAPIPKPKKSESFVSIMTRKVKPEPLNPIGKCEANAHSKSQPYTCVGIGFAEQSFSSTSDRRGQSSEHPVTSPHQEFANLGEANDTDFHDQSGTPRTTRRVDIQEHGERCIGTIREAATISACVPSKEPKQLRCAGRIRATHVFRRNWIPVPPQTGHSLLCWMQPISRLPANSLLPVPFPIQNMNRSALPMTAMSLAISFKRKSSMIRPISGTVHSHANACWSQLGLCNNRSYQRSTVRAEIIGVDLVAGRQRSGDRMI